MCSSLPHVETVISDDDETDISYNNIPTRLKKKPSGRMKSNSSKATPKKALQKKKESVHERQERLKQQAKKEKAEMRDKFMNSLKGKLVDGIVETKLARRKHYDRAMGDYAASIKQVKDTASRRALYSFIHGSMTASKMMSYGDEMANRVCVRPTVAGLLVDRVIPEPHKSWL